MSQEIVQQSPQQAPRWNVEQSISPQEGMSPLEDAPIKAPGLEMIANFIADPGIPFKIRLGLDPTEEVGAGSLTASRGIRTSRLPVFLTGLAPSVAHHSLFSLASLGSGGASFLCGLGEECPGASTAAGVAWIKARAPHCSLRSFPSPFVSKHEHLAPALC